MTAPIRRPAWWGLHCPIWDYWADSGTDGQRGIRNHRNRSGFPPTRPYRWREHEAERDAWVAVMVGDARRRARRIIAAEITDGRWWVPRGFTVADLDAMIADVYE
jgi:hypothetical protein